MPNLCLRQQKPTYPLFCIAFLCMDKHWILPTTLEWVDTSHLLASYNTPASGRRGATLSATYLGGHLTFTSIIQLQYIPTHQQPVGVGLHYQLPTWVDTSRLLESHNYNTPTAGRRGATLSATYLGGHLTFTSNHRHADRQTDKTDRQNSNLVSSPSHYAIVI